MLPSAVIAVVDDDESAREGVSDLVSTLGFDVRAFVSAEDFLQFDEVASCLCLIVDMKLGKMSGLDLHDFLIASGARIPTILITAYPDEQLRLRAFASGVVCYLRKPFMAQELLSCLRRALGKHYPSQPPQPE